MTSTATWWEPLDSIHPDTHVLLNMKMSPKKGIDHQHKPRWYTTLHKPKTIVDPITVTHPLLLNNKHSIRASHTHYIHYITLTHPYLTIDRWKQDITVLTRFRLMHFYSGALPRGTPLVSVQWGWTASYQTIALNSVLSDGLIKTHYLLCIFVMTFTDVLHCSGRLVISIKTYIEQLESIYQ